jgi:membrane-associated phospholipid phosphatase
MPPPSVAPAPPLSPYRPAAALLAAWLVVSAAASAAEGAAREAPALLAAQLALLAAAVWALRTRAAGAAATALAAWLPLLAVPVCYAALPRVAAGLGRAALHDARVLRWEEALFGTSPALTFGARWPAPALGTLLHLGYLSYYALIYLPPAWLWWRGRRDAFAAAVLAVWATFVACYVVFAWWPVQGPWYQWPAPATIPDGAARRLVLALLDAGSSRGTAFPSSHVAVAVAQTAALARVAPRLALPAAVATVLLAAGAVYGGFHYGVDVVAGAALGLVVGVVGPKLVGEVGRAG